MDRQGILLESGTNEMEIMKFTIGDQLYGINVAKVREILMAEPSTPVPHAHPAIEGIFKPRDEILTIVDLPYYLTGKDTEFLEKDLFMITNFNQTFIAFRVNTVVGIQRLSWGDIKQPDKTTVGGAEDGITTGVAESDGKLLMILDFEKIVADIAPETSFSMDDIKGLPKKDRKNHTIMIAEDSSLITKLLLDSLGRAGYVDVLHYNNGAELWEAINVLDKENIKDHVSLIITDIEMPQMDGHRLVKLIKDDKHLRVLPIIIFSSLINREMMLKGEELGANAQLSKPEIARLVATVDELVGENIE